MSVRVSLRRMLRLIRVDTLRRVRKVGFLAGRLIYFISFYNIVSKLSRGTNKITHVCTQFVFKRLMMMVIIIIDRV